MIHTKVGNRLGQLICLFEQQDVFFLIKPWGKSTRGRGCLHCSPGRSSRSRRSERTIHGGWIQKRSQLEQSRMPCWYGYCCYGVLHVVAAAAMSRACASGRETGYRYKKCGQFLEQFPRPQGCDRGRQNEL